MIKAGQAYDQRNEFEHREGIERELANTYRKNQDVIIPYGKTLGFNGTNGEQVILSYDETFRITIDGSTVVELATDSSLTTLEGRVTTAEGDIDTAQSAIITNSASISTINGNLSASYALTVDVNGKIASMKLLSDGSTSTIAFDATSFRVYNGTSNETPFEVTGGAVKIKTANVGTLTASNISVSNLSSLSADLGTVTAGQLNLTSGSYVVRHGAGFGASSDLVLWYGASATAIGSATKTNGVFALATDGKIYAGNAELSNPVRVTIGSAINVIGSSGFSGTITVTATGGNGSYTYQWVKEPYESGIAASLTNSTTATVTVSASLATGEDSTGRVRCYVYDGNGVTASISQAYNFSKTS